MSIFKALRANLILVLILFLMMACSDSSTLSNESPKIGNQYKDKATVDDTYSSNSGESDLKKESKIIKRGNLDFEVSDLKEGKRKVDSLVAKHKAYYEREQFNSDYHRISYSLLIRIPNAKFNTLIEELENDIGKLNAKKINLTDVTEEYVDLNIRLENNLAYLNQYKEILKKAKTIEDILKVQEKIRRIEEEIESKKGRIQFLDNRVNYSTLQLEISELISVKISNQPTFGRRITNAFKNGIDGLLNFTIVMVNLWPFLLIGILLLLFRKQLINLIKRK